MYSLKSLLKDTQFKQQSSKNTNLDHTPYNAPKFIHKGIIEFF